MRVAGSHCPEVHDADREKDRDQAGAALTAVKAGISRLCPVTECDSFH
jgi:hypothetical protein